MGGKKLTLKERLTNFGHWAYNRENHTVFGRTALSWGLIFLFYVVFYLVLAAFFIGMLSVLLYGVVVDSHPKLTGPQSLMRMSPSIDFKPRTVIDATFIDYSRNDSTTWAPQVANIMELYNSYSTINNTFESPAMEYANCSLEDPQANKGFDPSKKICRMDPRIHWGNCTPANNFGYPDAKPCVMLKLNRMFGWIPKISTPMTVPFNHTMVVCEGENDGDMANLGRVEYYPGVTYKNNTYGYFSSALLPFLNQPGYTSAVVAVKFVGIRHNVAVIVQCRIFNVDSPLFDKVNRIGVTHFELLVRST